jgi:hypothetical protein
VVVTEGREALLPAKLRVATRNLSELLSRGLSQHKTS